MKLWIKTSKGFTLIELVIYLGISVVVLVATTVFIWDMIENKIKAVAHQETEQNARMIMAKLKQVTSQAKKFSGLSTCLIPNPAIGNSSTTQPSQLCFDEKFRFKIENEKLKFSEDNGTSWQNLTSDQVRIADFSFKNYSYPGVNPLYYRVNNFHATVTVAHLNLSNSTLYAASTTLGATFELQNN